jgi:hypothetical protein
MMKGTWGFDVLRCLRCSRCLRALSTVSATGLSCHEATSAFASRCDMALCEPPFEALSEGFTVLLSLHGASHATRP